MSKIKTSQHTVKFSNREKKKNLSSVIAEYRRVGQFMVDDIWVNGYTWLDSNNTGHEFSIEKNKLEFPSFIEYNRFNIDTFLTARALSTLCTQIAGMIKASVEKQRKRIYMLQKKKEEGESKKKRKQLAKRLKENIPQKPDCSNINMEVSSKCSDWLDVSGEFDGFLRLKSLTKDKTHIKIPIKHHKHSNKLARKGSMMTSFLISNHNVNIRWELPETEKKTEGKTVGADQGLKDVIILSNGEKTPQKDKHGHTLPSITDKLSRKRKGSNTFRKAQQHRKNFINWAINQLSLEGVKTFKLEHIWNIGYKTRKSRYLSHWTNSLIRDKVEDYCEENKVYFKSQSSTFRSQRCSGCGVVRKANRKGKTYSCKHCGLELDSDFNASLNLEIDLPEIPYTLRKSKCNQGNGFYWIMSGFFDYSTGRSLESLPPVEV